MLLYTNNSLHFTRKYAVIFVRGHYLFREVSSFPYDYLFSDMDNKAKAPPHSTGVGRYRTHTLFEKTNGRCLRCDGLLLED